MNEYMKDLAKLLSENSYPGRGIVVGKSQDGKNAMIAYFIMGRSENSSNRVFIEDREGRDISEKEQICTNRDFDYVRSNYWYIMGSEQRCICGS